MSRTTAASHSLRLIINNGRVISAPEKTATAEKTTSIIEENQTIIKSLKEALINEYGDAIASFAFPAIEIEVRLKEGSDLTALAAKQILRKAIILQHVLSLYKAPFPLPEKPSDDACQAYLNAIATYAKQEAMEAVRDTNADNVPKGLSPSVTDALITSLFNATPGPALEHLGNYIMSHPTALATAAAASIGTEPHPISIGAFGLTTLIMNATATAAVATAVSESTPPQDSLSPTK